MRNLKSVRRTPPARSRRFFLAALLSLCAIFPATVLYALHEVDHRFTVKGRICGDDGEGMGAVVVSVKNIRADISGNGKTDSDGFYEVVLHLHNENQGDPLVVQSGKFEATGRVELDPGDPKTERIITINLGKDCRALPFWRNGWVQAGAVVLFAFALILSIRQFGRKKVKSLGEAHRKKSRKKP